jgi:hypothetical protein
VTRADQNIDFACTCGVVERATHEPSVPVIFDENTNEFHLVCNPEHKGSMILYYCFFCGGSLPKSKRDLLFAVVTQAETARLKNLTRDIRTIEDAIRVFGVPDFDLPDGETVSSPQSETEPVHIESFRVIGYSGLSQTADVRITDYRRSRPGIVFIGKYIGEPK